MNKESFYYSNSELLYVGRSTKAKLASVNINTIGDLARAEPEFLERRLGNMGIILQSFANGKDSSEVLKEGDVALVKSICGEKTKY